MVGAVEGRRRQLDARAREALAQRGAEPATVVVAVVEVAQLHAQQGGLQRVEARGRADDPVVVARLLAVRAQQPDALGELPRRWSTIAPPSPHPPRFLVG